MGVHGAQSHVGEGSGVQLGPSPGFSLALPQENQVCSPFTFEARQWARSLPHQSPGKWWGWRVGGGQGVGKAGGEEIKLCDHDHD